MTAWYLRMNYWWTDCGGDWKEEMEWITAAVVSSEIMSSRWDSDVMHTARCGCVTLIHTLPYLPHASHMGGHLSTLAECKVYANIHPSIHTHTHTREVWTTSVTLLLKQLTHSLKDKWYWQKYAVREVHFSSVCLCVLVFSVQKKGCFCQWWGPYSQLSFYNSL